MLSEQQMCRLVQTMKNIALLAFHYLFVVSLSAWEINTHRAIDRCEKIGSGDDSLLQTPLNTFETAAGDSSKKRAISDCL